MELLDILNENGTKNGMLKTREEAHKDGLLHKIACVFVVNDDGKIILQKRSQYKKTNPNGWTCSASGHVDAGEDSLTGGLRELEEEIGVKAKEDDLEYIGTVIEKYNHDKSKIAHIAEVYILKKNIPIEELILQEEEVSDAKYFSFEEIDNLDFPGKHPGIYNLLKSRLQ